MMMIGVVILVIVPANPVKDPYLLNVYLVLMDPIFQKDSA